MANRACRNRALSNRRNGCIERIVKPLPGLAYFTNNDTGVLPTAAELPLDDILFLGKNIENAENSAKRLDNGVYKITFSAVAVPSQDGAVSLSVILNGNATNIVSAQTATQNTKNALSASGIVVAVTNNTLISLRNTGVDTAFLFVNLVVHKI